MLSVLHVLEETQMDSGMKATLAVLRLPVAHTTDIPPPSSPPSTSRKTPRSGYPNRSKEFGEPEELGEVTHDVYKQKSLEELPAF